jgi:hypothetical protein
MFEKCSVFRFELQFTLSTISISRILRFGKIAAAAVCLDLLESEIRVKREDCVVASSGYRSYLR